MKRKSKKKHHISKVVCEKCNKTNDRFEKMISFFSLMITLVSVIVAIVSLKFSQRIVEYQITQERLPNIVALNQDLRFCFETTSLERQEICMDLLVKDNDYMINIPVYNVGVGLAQNCKFDWNEESVYLACEKIIEMLDNNTNLNLKEFNFNDIDQISWLCNDYNIEIEDGKIKSLVFYNKESRGYEQFELLIENVSFPYILPIKDQTEKIDIKVPEVLSILLLEAAFQEIQPDIVLDCSMSYQDLAGKYYSEMLEISFVFNECEIEDSEWNCSYNVICRKKNII